MVEFVMQRAATKIDRFIANQRRVLSEAFRSKSETNAIIVSVN